MSNHQDDQHDLIRALEHRIDELEHGAEQGDASLLKTLREIYTPCGSLEQLLAKPYRCPSVEQALHDVLIFGLTEEGRFKFLWVANNLAQKYGVPRGAFDNKTLRDVFGDTEAAQERYALLHQALAMKTAVRAEQVYQAPNGKEFYHDTRVVPLLRDDGSVELVLGFARDVTEHRNIEKRLRESETNYRRVVEKVSDGLVIHCGGVIQYANPATEHLFGAPVEKLVGTNVLAYIHDDQKHEAIARLQKLRSGATKLPPILYKLLRADGSILHAEVNSSPIRFHDQDAVLITVRDVTESVRQAARQRRIERQLQQSQKLESLVVLAGGIAHDFNNLLMGVLGNASLAALEIPEETKGRNRLVQIQNAAHQAADLTKQLLAYAGGGMFVPQPVDFSKLVHDMTTLVQVSLSKNITLQLDTDDNLPLVLGDPVQLRQVTMNLLINASEATDSTSGEVEISTEKIVVTDAWLSKSYFRENATPGPYALLRVKDNGCGLSETDLQKIFDPFFSTKGTSRGLGLAAVLGIVRAHGGAVRVNSVLGEGTEFLVVFPFAAYEKDAPLPDEISSVGIATWRSEGQILLVDDEDNVRIVAGEVLERFGFSVTETENGREALALFTESPQRFRAILLDLTLPGMQGDEVLRRIRELRADIPVVLSSGYSAEIVASTVRRFKNVVFVQKPYTVHKLGAALRHLLRKMAEAGD